ncbi:maleylpyruvate isomerase family mycothiol-dependent enzyme [Streptomyces sp. NPDC050610]|uniref:maleylpyruvate isomerase family mycothiol-dependent enzyme n=1 Tax=Streptomyces sp. NPDC050610 TaxID=3157097 RepID=UPI003448E860
MDRVALFHRETLAFEAAARKAAGTGASPLVRACPGWSVADLVLHLGQVHRLIICVIDERLKQLPDTSDLAVFEVPVGAEDWPMPENAPNRAAPPTSLLDWFAEGAATLESLFSSRDPGEEVWTWAPEQTTGFWLRMQTIEAAVHRWDAESASGTAQPVDAGLAADAIGQNFTVMAPARRAWKQAPAGSGERYLLRQTDGSGLWNVRFEGEDVRLSHDVRTSQGVRTSQDVRTSEGKEVGSRSLELTGTASDLLLFLWQRIPADPLDVTGDRSLLDHYFTLVPPI